MDVNARIDQAGSAWAGILPMAERRERVVNFELIYAGALVVQPILASVSVLVWIIDPNHNRCAVHAVVSTTGIFKTD